MIDNLKINELAVAVRNMFEEDENKARQSHEYHQLMSLFFGYNGEEGNIIQKLSEDVYNYGTSNYHALTDRAWKSLENTIISYDIEQGNFIRFATLNILKRAAALAYESVGEDCVYNFDFDSMLGDSRDPYEGIDELDRAVELRDKVIDVTVGNRGKREFIMDYMMHVYAGVHVDHIDEILPNREVDKSDKSQKFNTAECARLMAQVFGGSYDACEKYVNRFRNQAIEKLGLTLNTTYGDGKTSFYDVEKLHQNHERAQKHKNAMKPSKVVTYVNGSVVRVEDAGRIVDTDEKKFKRDISKKDIDKYLYRGDKTCDDREWAKGVYREFGFKCVVCGSGNKLNAHHIFGKARYPEHRHNPNNGVLLCEECHITGDNALHKQEGSKTTQHITGDKLIDWLVEMKVSERTISKIEEKIKTITM